MEAILDLEFPITLARVLTIPGLAIIATVFILWLNKYMPERYKFFVNLLALVLCEIIAFVACFIVAQWHPTAESLFLTFLLGLFATTLQCFGYEMVKNLYRFGVPSE